MKIKLFLGIAFLLVLTLTIVSGASTFEGDKYNSFGGSSYTYSSPQYTQPGFMGSDSGYYGLYPGYDRETCQARMDFLIQIAPGGCTPAVVRSDLLAEQDVAVFCKLQALQINPFIDTTTIRNLVITHRGNLPEGVSGVGYHRPQIALTNGYNEQGFFTLDNIGYAVIKIKQQPDERKLLDSVSGNLTIKVQYDASNTFGMGKSELISPALSLEEWQADYPKYGIMNGQVYLRVESIEEENVRVSVYRDFNTKIDTINLKRGETSAEKYLSGFNCAAAYTISVGDSIAPRPKAKINFQGDVYDVYQGEKFADGVCIVDKISPGVLGTGSVTGKCYNKQFVLRLNQKPVQLEVDGTTKEIAVGSKIKEGVYLAGSGIYLDTKFVLLFKGASYDSASKITAQKNVDLIKKQGTSVELTDKDKYVVLVIDELGIGGSQINSGIKFVELKVADNFVSDNPDFENSFSSAIGYYEEVEDNYGEFETMDNENYEIYGVVALDEASSFASNVWKKETAVELAQKLKDKYNVVSSVLLTETNFDYSESASVIDVNDLSYSISLESVDEPEEKDYAVLIEIDGALAPPVKREGTVLFDNIKVDSFTNKEVKITGKCADKDVGETLKLAETKEICGKIIYVKQINYNSYAKISFEPITRRLGSEVNISYSIGIEKRAIELNPEKAAERIKKLNESIAKWTNINKNLGDVVKTMKTACFATTAALQVKNLFGNLGGKAIARNSVMTSDNGWNQKCTDIVAENPSISFDKCIKDNADKIESDVEARYKAIQEVNNAIKEIESNLPAQDGILNTKVIDTEASLDKTIKNIQSEFGNDATYKDKVAMLNKETLSYDEAREIWVNLKLQRESASEVLKLSSKTSLENTFKSIEAIQKRESVKDKLEAGSVTDNFVFGTIETDKSAKVIPYSGSVAEKDLVSGGVIISKGKPVGGVTVGASNYMVELVNTGENKYKVAKGDDNTAHIYEIGDSGNIISAIKTDNPVYDEIIALSFQKFDSTSYNNKWSSPKVRYYETGVYKGMPAVVPVDASKGWYAGTKPVLAGFGDSTTFQESGRVSSFWVCNVGENGREQFNSGLGDDVCEQFNVGTGQSFSTFPGLSEADASSIIKQAMAALEDAARNYKSGLKKVSIRGKTYDVDDPAVAISGTRCTDFMSARDCQIMFNVCDPVICPSSRCNLGGSYYVDDVVQSGIVGSIFLCLPNYKEGIFIPVCLTGIHAGIENWISIMSASRDCLQESIDSGRYVGICDEITAIYKCEFFWKQFSPLMNNIIPKLLERLSGNSVRGGGEYLSVQSAWDNMQSSINYFKNEYGVNAMKAFRARSTDEVGTEVCKSFISFKYANKFETLIEPDSPSQYSAWFTEIQQTTATIPAISQYKVYYHIYAGNDAGIYYSVYLKNRAGETFYDNTGYLNVVASGYINKGEYVDIAKDFTAPSGFKELCIRVNGQDDCGFKQVSTSFALNYLRDKYVQSEATEQITKEDDCISGTPNAAAVLLTPNIQAGVEESINTNIYERGIIRVCSTENPGSTTEPSRWEKVGYCTDSKVGCWLDTESISNAITSGNVGVKDATLAEIQALVDEQKQEEKAGRVYTDLEIANALTEVRNKIPNVKTEEEASDLIVELETIENSPSILVEKQRAEIIFLKAKTKRALSEQLWKEVQAGLAVKRVNDYAATGKENPEAPATPETPETPETPVETGLNDEVPEVLQPLFLEVSEKTGVPAALIAAISNQECSDLWGDAQTDPTKIIDLIDNDKIPASRDICNYNNKYNVFGPMQFRIGKAYLKEHGMEIYQTTPDGKPNPNVGTWEGYVSNTAELLEIDEEALSPLIIRHSVYAAAIKLKKDAGSPTDWTEAEIKEAAKGYFGACTAEQTIGGKKVTVNYCDDIISKYNKYKVLKESTPFLIA
ncbi:MAG: hypothetical protein WC533_04585 [Candidatus Pacearchaeota archaeon]